MKNSAYFKKGDDNEKKRELRCLIFIGLAGAVLGLMFKTPAILFVLFAAIIVALAFPQWSFVLAFVISAIALFILGFATLLITLRVFKFKVKK